MFKRLPKTPIPAVGDGNESRNRFWPGLEIELGISAGAAAPRRPLPCPSWYW